MRNTPTPEPQSYIDAQVASIVDPQSVRDTVLVTPGSPMPSAIPQGLTVAKTSRGVVITKDPSKVQIIDQGTEDEVGMALLGYAYNQRDGYDSVATASDQNGTPVAEIAVRPGDEQRAMSLVDMLAPSGGNSALVPRADTVKRRVSGLLGMME